MSTAHVDIAEALRGLSPGDDLALAALGQTLRNDAHEGLDAVTRCLSEVGIDASAKAMAVLGQASPWAIVPLLDRHRELPLTLSIWALRTAGLQWLELTRFVGRALDAALGDRRCPPWSRGPEGEERPHPLRVCDEAYLQAIGILGLRGGDMSHIEKARTFVFLLEDGRDREIDGLRATQGWVDLVA